MQQQYFIRLKSFRFWKVSAEPSVSADALRTRVLRTCAQCTLQIAEDVEKARLARPIQLLGVARLRLILISPVFAESKNNNVLFIGLKLEKLLTKMR